MEINRRDLLAGGAALMAVPILPNIAEMIPPVSPVITKTFNFFAINQRNSYKWVRFDSRFDPPVQWGEID